MPYISRCLGTGKNMEPTKHRRRKRGGQPPTPPRFLVLQFWPPSPKILFNYNVIVVSTIEITENFRYLLCKHLAMEGLLKVNLCSSAYYYRDDLTKTGRLSATCSGLLKHVYTEKLSIPDTLGQINLS